MIVRFPNVPPVEGKLKLPRPAVFLIGSYGRHMGWADLAARELDPHVGCIFIANEIVPSGADALKAEWLVTWLQAVDIVACWVAGPEWDQFELGYALGRAGSRPGLHAPVIGTTIPEIRESVEAALSVLGFDPIVFADFNTWLSAVEASARGLR